MMNEHDNPLADRIREARRAAGITQRELAARVGVSLGLIDRYETGRADPGPRFAQIAEATGKPLSWFHRNQRATPAAADSAVLLAEERATLARNQELENRRNELKRREEALAAKMSEFAERERQVEQAAADLEQRSSAVTPAAAELAAGREELRLLEVKLERSRARIEMRTNELRQARLAHEKAVSDLAIRESLATGKERQLADLERHLELTQRELAERSRTRGDVDATRASPPIDEAPKPRRLVEIAAERERNQTKPTDIQPAHETDARVAGLTKRLDAVAERYGWDVDEQPSEEEESLQRRGPRRRGSR